MELFTVEIREDKLYLVRQVMDWDRQTETLIGKFVRIDKKGKVESGIRIAGILIHKTPMYMDIMV